MSRPFVMTQASARLLVGRRIVGYQGNPTPDGRGGTAHSPVIELDNGATLSFTTEETESGKYGTACTYARCAPSRPNPRNPGHRRTP